MIGRTEAITMFTRFDIYFYYETFPKNYIFPVLWLAIVLLFNMIDRTEAITMFTFWYLFLLWNISKELYFSCVVIGCCSPFQYDWQDWSHNDVYVLIFIFAMKHFQKIILKRSTTANHNTGKVWLTANLLMLHVWFFRWRKKSGRKTRKVFKWILPKSSHPIRLRRSLAPCDKQN